MANSVTPKFFLFIWLSASVFTACTPDLPPAKPWREELTIAVVQDKNSVGSEFRQQLIALLGKQLQVKIKLLPLSPDQVIPAVINGKAHIAAVGLRSNNSGKLRFTPSYQSVNERVVCGNPPQHLEGLVGKNIVVVADSAQNDALREMQQKLPELKWEASHKQLTVADLISEVASGALECTVADDEQLAEARNFYPKLEASFDIAAPARLAWALAPDGDEALFTETQKFFNSIKQDGTLRRLLDRYYGHNDRLEPVDSVAFISSVRNQLPQFRQLFQEAGLLTGIDWQLLAAIGYHESHWNPLATSYTNVRGIMMLTEETADRMKVSDRLDPRQSILAGARYLQLLKEQLPLRISDEERTWLALAAYNQGQGHLEDARVLAAQNGLNPDSWTDVKMMMPLLSQPAYFDQTKHGYARGGEAVVLVETVHLYYDMLKHLDTHEIPRLPTTPFHLRLPEAKKFNLP